MARIQVVIDEAERERFRARARAEGMSLSEWLREAGRSQLREAHSRKLRTTEDIDQLFAELDAQRPSDEREPDWEVVKERMAKERYEDSDPLGIDG